MRCGRENFCRGPRVTHMVFVPSCPSNASRDLFGRSENAWWVWASEKMSSLNIHYLWKTMSLLNSACSTPLTTPSSGALRCILSNIGTLQVSTKSPINLAMSITSSLTCLSPKQPPVHRIHSLSAFSPVSQAFRSISSTAPSFRASLPPDVSTIGWSTALFPENRKGSSCYVHQ
jgi:hypothetical protein